MRHALATITCLFLVGCTPALAAPQWVQDDCLRQAKLVRAALRWYEQEAYIANCIADYTATPQGKRRKYKKSH